MNEKISKFLSSRVFLVALATTLTAVAFVWLFFQVGLLKRQGSFVPMPSLSQNPPLTGNIRGWMSFAYLSKIYAVPAAYMEQTLNIPANNFRRLSVHHYARLNGLSDLEAAQKVELAIQNYKIQTTK